MNQSQETNHHRLQRLYRWCRTGRTAAAELELADWSRNADCVGGARVLLASLRSQRGELESARSVWPESRDLQVSELSQEEAERIISLDSLLGRSEEAAAITRQLHHHHGHMPQVGRWLAVSDAPGVSELPQETVGRAEALADTLENRMSLLPTLVFAQQQRPTSAGISGLKAALLRLSVRHAQHKEHSLTIYRSLAQLAQLAGDEDEARRWAHRGLKLDPYCATLAMVLSWVPDESHAPETARDVLARVSARHPGYRDVSAALQRREQIDKQQTTQRRAA